MKSMTKELKPKPEQQFVLHSNASASKFNRGLLGAVVAFVEKKGAVDAPALIAEFKATRVTDARSLPTVCCATWRTAKHTTS